MEQLILDAGWTDLGPQKSAHLRAFQKGKYRMNYYPTTGSITVQLTTERYDSGDIYKKVTEEELKNDILPGY